MNKIVKGSIAGAAGVALLLGGAGTFALWNDSVNVNASTITSGKLDLASVADSAGWHKVTGTTVATTAIDEDYLVVPGEVFEYQEDLDVTLEGDALVATLGYDEDIADENGFVVSSFTLVDEEGDVVAPDAIVTSGTYTVKLRVAFGSNTAVDDNAATQNKTFEAETVTFSLEQTAL